MSGSNGNRYTQRTRTYLRDLGYTVGTVEHWNSFVNRRYDLFGFIDLVAIGNGHIVAIQSTSATGHSERRKKIFSLVAAGTWLQSGGLIWLISWRKKPEKRGGKRMLWHPRKEVISMSEWLENTTNENIESPVPDLGACM